jgi:pRiA4b ORF-3-like protein
MPNLRNKRRYQLRAVLRGIRPLIWRRLLVRSDSTVAQLHEVLQIGFGWCGVPRRILLA